MKDDVSKHVFKDLIGKTKESSSKSLTKSKSMDSGTLQRFELSADNENELQVDAKISTVGSVAITTHPGKDKKDIPSVRQVGDKYYFIPSGRVISLLRGDSRVLVPFKGVAFEAKGRTIVELPFDELITQIRAATGCEQYEAANKMDEIIKSVCELNDQQAALVTEDHIVEKLDVPASDATTTTPAITRGSRGGRR